MYIFIGKERENSLVNMLKKIDDYICIVFPTNKSFVLVIQGKYDLTAVSWAHFHL